jgi:hypothetical protein
MGSGCQATFLNCVGVWHQPARSPLPSQAGTVDAPSMPWCSSMPSSGPFPQQSLQDDTGVIDLPQAKPVAALNVFTSCSDGCCGQV